MTAYAGIQMLRDLNTNYLAPWRRSIIHRGSGRRAMPEGAVLDLPQRVYKPLYGFQMAKHYPAIWGRTRLVTRSRRVHHATAPV